MQTLGLSLIKSKDVEKTGMMFIHIQSAQLTTIQYAEDMFKGCLVKLVPFH